MHPVTQAALQATKPIAFDTFTRNDGVLGTAESGHPWQVEDANWSIDGRRIIHRTTADKAAWVDCLLGNVCVETLTLETSGGAAFITPLLRFIDANNYIMSFVSTNVCRIFKKDGGAFTQLSSVSFTPSTTKSHLVAAVAKGSKIDVCIDGLLITSYLLTGADAAKYHSGITKHGLFGSTTVTAFADNFSVKRV